MTETDAPCEETITFVDSPDRGPETLRCYLTAGHDGHHLDGNTTWGRARILGEERADA